MPHPSSSSPIAAVATHASRAPPPDAEDDHDDLSVALLPASAQRCSQLARVCSPLASRSTAWMGRLGRRRRRPRRAVDLPTGSVPSDGDGGGSPERTPPRRTAAEKAHARRDGGKEAEGGKDGLLVARRVFRRDYGRLVSGERTQCLADALAHALEAEQGAVRAGIGADHCFARAAAYVEEAHPERQLVKTALLQVKGGPAVALLDAAAGRFVLAMSYWHDGAKRYHCAFYDAGFAWEREDLERGWLRGRGVLKDNQADVAVHLAEASDRASKEAARAFFAAPYACTAARRLPLGCLAGLPRRVRGGGPVRGA